ncbi:protocadherin gamma-A8 isoform X21 [Phyllostomus hastatus]|uniref:protocadherin gamma-A8 isoform X21 n=1 Tax=Phyllostomus hastatus TaxID=9423 RepID=UPI001E67E518|nr:protocadherin gamma-A8 isoform X21 [Phyllostomus hastatus]
MAAPNNYGGRGELVLLCALLGTLWEMGRGQLHYSVPEESDKGSFVGNISKDLGLESQELAKHGVRIVSRDSGKSHLIFPQPNYADTLISQESCEKNNSLLTSIDFHEGKDEAASVQQAPPNTDWRFSQAQRPGTSGSQNGDETGTWPNNQFDTEMLQAMILASASEAADGSSTLGGGAGTMGLSARYGPQFTLQHVPDYRQNVYIPGSNATLTNAAGKRDGKAPAGGNGNKKKSGKKEKK